MTIEEHMYLKGDKPPLPNEVIDLKESINPEQMISYPMDLVKEP